MEKIMELCFLDFCGNPDNNSFHFRFVCKNNGVLFENDLLQIGVKSEYRQNLGRVGVFYGNKTSFQFTAFCVDISEPNQLSSHILSTK